MSYRESHLAKGSSYDQELARDAFDAYMASWENHHLRVMVPRLLPSGVPRYLDFACGTGRITSVMAPMVSEAIGVDISEDMLRVARRKVPTASFECADLTARPLDLGLFDLVTAFRFLGNAEDELRMDALVAINRLQAPGSMLIVNNHRNPLAPVNVIGRVRGWTAELDLTHRKLRRLLGACGYRLRRSKPIAAWQCSPKLVQTAGDRPDLEKRLERLFGASPLSHIAPDTVVVATKVRDLPA